MEQHVTYQRIKSEIEAKSCPLHNIRPLVRVEYDHITIRCCCDMYTSLVMAELDKKLKGINLLNVVDAWEEQVFNHGLQVA
jgi:hypothetical protein